MAQGYRCPREGGRTFAEVHFQLPPDTDVYRIPTSALVFREQGLQIAIVGADDKVVLKSVTAGRDLGTELEILSGLDPSDQVIDNPPGLDQHRRCGQGLRRDRK